jgi:hypothetical protein
MADATAKKSPLDVLEEILNDAQGKGGGASDGAGLAADPNAPAGAAAAATPADQAVADQQALAKIEEQVAQQNAQDQVQMTQHLAQIQEITHSPEYQAVVQQEDAKKQEVVTHQEEHKGFEIIQLGHTKV